MATPDLTPSKHQRQRFTRDAFLKGGGALIVAIGVPAGVWRITRGGSDAPQTWPAELDA